MANPGRPDGDQVEYLRQENARLRSQLELLREQAAPPRDRAGGRHAGRWTAAVALLVVGILLTPVTVVAVWARNAIFNTDRYVETVAPLARNPVMQDAIANRITAEVFRAVDIDGLVDRSVSFLARQGAPEQVALLADPVKKGLQSFATSQVLAIVRSDEFARAWDEANRAAHQGLVAALTGEGSGGITISGDTVSVNLGAFIAAIRPQLAEAGFPLADRIPAVNVSFTILQSDQLPRIQRAARALDDLVLPLTLVTLALLLLGVGVAPDRRRMVLAAGAGIAAALAALLGALAFAREFYLTHLPAGTQSVDAAAAIWDTLVRFLVSAAQKGIVLGIVVVILAWLAGPARPAVALRRFCATAARRVARWLGQLWQRLRRRVSARREPRAT